jgi:hypothetical protein
VVTGTVDRPEVRLVAGSAARDRDNARDSALLGEERVAQVHEQGGDAARVALSGAQKASVDIRMEKELRHGESLGPWRIRGWTLSAV